MNLMLASIEVLLIAMLVILNLVVILIGIPFNFVFVHFTTDIGSIHLTKLHDLVILIHFFVAQDAI